MTGSIENVEKETEKVLHKFKELSKHGEHTLSELIQQIDNYQQDLCILTRSFLLCLIDYCYSLITFYK